MIKTKQLLVAIAIVLTSASLDGCSAGVASTAPVQVSQEDVNQSQVFRAKQFLDNIEKLPPDKRQMAANVPAAAEALSAASQTDPATKKRIEDLGLTISTPARRGRRG